MLPCTLLGGQHAAKTGLEPSSDSSSVSSSRCACTKPTLIRGTSTKYATAAFMATSGAIQLMQKHVPESGKKSLASSKDAVKIYIYIYTSTNVPPCWKKQKRWVCRLVAVEGPLKEGVAALRKSALAAPHTIAGN